MTAIKSDSYQTWSAIDPHTRGVRHGDRIVPDHQASMTQRELYQAYLEAMMSGEEPDIRLAEESELLMQYQVRQPAVCLSTIPDNVQIKPFYSNNTAQSIGITALTKGQSPL